MTEKLKPPIILIGNYRSGTGIVQNLIGLSPDIAIWYEPRTVWRYADPGRRHEEFDETDATEKAVRYIRGRFLKFQMQHGGRRVMEKTPSNNLKVPYVHAIFPEATYLNVTRNPFSYISSMEFKWQRTKDLKGIRRSLRETPVTQLPYYAGQFARDMVRKKLLKKRYVSIYGPRYKGIEQDLNDHGKLRVMAKQWAIVNRKAREDLAALLGEDRVFSFLYEDLMEHPQTLFRQIYDHCGLEYDDDMLRRATEMVDPGRQEKWRRLDQEQLKEIMPELQAEMDVYGYEIPPQLR